MEKLMRNLVMITFIVGLSACSKMDTIRIAAGHAVEKYCSIPEGARGAARSQLDKAIAPNSIKVTCSGD